MPALVRRHRALSLRRASSISRSARRPRSAGSTARTARDTRAGPSARSAGRASSGRRPTASGSASQPARSTHRRGFASRLTSTPGRRSTGTSSPTTGSRRRRRPARSRSAGRDVVANSAQASPERVPILARLTDLVTPLHELFGFDAFRPGQEDVVRAAIAGRDTLALMPTGSGKSLTYQLAAMLRPEPTLVLSPLIALMKDQVDKLPPRIAATATFVNSSLERGRDGRAARRRLRRGHTPRLRGPGAAEAVALRRAPRDGRHRARGRRRGALREHVGPRLPARLPLHPSWSRGTRQSHAPRHDRDGHAGDGTRHRAGARSLARDRPHERDAPESALRRAGGRQRRGSARDPRRATQRAPRRLGDRVRAVAPLDRRARARPPGSWISSGALPRRSRGAGAHPCPGRLRLGRHAGRRRHDGVRHGHRQARRETRLPRELPGLARGVRADGGSGGARRRAERDAPAGEPDRCNGAPAIRGVGRAHGGRAPRRLPAAQRRKRARRPRGPRSSRARP